nr:hypothetical protein [uncultured Anaeromusa sp.]
MRKQFDSTAKLLRILRHFFLLTGLLLFYSASAFAGGSVEKDTSPQVAQYFETAKKNEAELVAFLHKMPKGADLHNHPWGAVYTETLLDSAIAQNLVFDRTTRSFVKETTNPCYTAQELKQNNSKMGEVLSALSLRNQPKEKENGHDHFFDSFGRFAAAVPNEEDMLREQVGRAISQKIRYLELMTEPPREEEAIRTWLQQMEAARRETIAQAGGTWNVDVAYIVPINRNALPESLKSGPWNQEAYEEFFTQEIRQALTTIIRFSDQGIRSLTFLDPEDSWISRTQFDTQMRILDREWRRIAAENPANAAKLKVNLHAGELTLAYSPYEPMRNRISQSISLGHASRIGHGISIQWENDVYGLLRQMRDHKTAVEICLTSNDGILNVTGGDKHPFRLYWDADVPVALCTDDEGISRSNLTMEYTKATQWFGLSYGNLKWLAFSSLEYSYLPGESLFMNGDFNRLKTAPPQGSAKAVLEQQLHEDFQRFEGDMEKNIRLMKNH